MFWLLFVVFGVVGCFGCCVFWIFWVFGQHSEIFGNRLCRSPRRGLVRNNFESLFVFVFLVLVEMENRAFSDVFGNVPKQFRKFSETDFWRSPRRGLVRDKFESSSFYELHTTTFKWHLHGNRRFSMICFQSYHQCFYSKKHTTLASSLRYSYH